MNTFFSRCLAITALCGHLSSGLASSETAPQQCSPAAIVALHADAAKQQATQLLDAPVRTVVDAIATRSAGDKHAFYSEGDYWWPVAGQPDAPYERRDGESNPNNFTAHRESLMRFADIVGSATSAYVTSDSRAEKKRYAKLAERHLTAWLVDDDTRMAPHMLYAQAIQGRHTGRSIGLIDGLHLIEVALAARILGESQAISRKRYQAIQDWFTEFAQWMNTHPYGVKERSHPNNHSVAWSLQIAAYAVITEQPALTELVKHNFKRWYLPVMMAQDGSFPKETARTKPFGYSLFVIDLMAGIAQLASTPDDNLWRYATPSGRGMSLGIAFIAPYIADKSQWPLPRDIQYWEHWPMRHPALLFGGYQLGDCGLFNRVKTLPVTTDTYEIKRNFPIRHPILWVTRL